MTDPTHPSSYSTSSDFVTSLLSPFVPPSEQSESRRLSSGWDLLDLSPLPPSRRSHGLAFDDDQSLIISFGFHSSQPNSFQSLNDVWKFTPPETYDKLTSGGGLETGSHLSCVFENKLYITGGLKFQNQQWSNPSETSLHVLNLDDPTAGWESFDLPSIPSRGELAGGCVGGKMYFHGGLMIKGSNVLGMSDFWEVDLETKQESRLPSGPGARFSHAADVDDERFCLSAGRAFKPSGSWYMLSDLHCYDHNSKQWSDVTPSNYYERVYHSLNLYDGDLYQFGGYRSLVSGGKVVAMVDNDLLKTELTSSQWYQFNNGSSVPVRFQHAAKVMGEDLVLYGGRFETTDDCKAVNSLALNTLNSDDFILAPGDAGDEYDMSGGVHLVVAVMIITGLMLLAVFGAIRRRAAERGEEAGGMFGRSNNAGLEQAQIDEIPITTYQKKSLRRPSGAAVLDESADENDEGEGETCSICLCDFCQGDQIRELPCSHIFHPECVDTWLKRNSSCPACRQSIRTMQRANEVRERLQRVDSAGGGESGERVAWK
ncbi:hypothetical protein TL16_g11457 [Triparma laevis f. inornata]|uniref:RING-type domain-containing protein n=1 Tax=Triparma laevis f. inornata TaxID=1714386 RepID=A0A9W7BMQ6_9STRA|nr:hypothetical protein TL16_g11457 [Triparma laevis f. inornata]